MPIAYEPIAHFDGMADVYLYIIDGRWHMYGFAGDDPSVITKAIGSTPSQVVTKSISHSQYCKIHFLDENHVNWHPISKRDNKINICQID